MYLKRSLHLLLWAILVMTLPAQANEALLHSAAQGNPAEVKRLLAKGAAVDSRDARQRTPLLLATWGNHPQVAKILIKAGADVNAQDTQLDSPYLVAGAEGRTEILRMTLSHGANLMSTNRYGGTALIPASEHGHTEAVRLLIQAGVDVDHVNNLGWTALLEVVILGTDGDAHVDIVQQLIAAKADLNLADKKGITPLQHARQKGFKRIASLLSKAGAR